MKPLVRNFFLCWIPFSLFWVAVYPENGSPPFLAFKQVTVVCVGASILVTIFFSILKIDPLAGRSKSYVPYQGPEIGDHAPIPGRPSAPASPSSVPTSTPSQPPGCLPVEPRHD